MSGASYSDEPLYSLGIALQPQAAQLLLRVQLRMRRALQGRYCLRLQGLQPLPTHLVVRVLGIVPDDSAAPALPPDGAVSFALPAESCSCCVELRVGRRRQNFALRLQPTPALQTTSGDPLALGELE